MMKGYYKDCKNTKQVNTFLKKVTGEYWFDECYNFPVEFDYDCWQNEEETKGISVQVSTNYEVYVTKYTKKDIDEQENEINNR